jgi:hypothetical protein
MTTNTTVVSTHKSSSGRTCDQSDTPREGQPYRHFWYDSRGEGRGVELRRFVEVVPPRARSITLRLLLGLAALFTALLSCVKQKHGSTDDSRYRYRPRKLICRCLHMHDVYPHVYPVDTVCS